MAMVYVGGTTYCLFSQQCIDNKVFFIQADINVIQTKQDYYKPGIVHANILRSLLVARTPSEEAHSPGRRSNVENAPRRRPITGEPAMPTYHIRRATLRMPPVTCQSACADPAQPAVRTMSSYRGMDASL